MLSNKNYFSFSLIYTIKAVLQFIECNKSITRQKKFYSLIFNIYDCFFNSLKKRIQVKQKENSTRYALPNTQYYVKL